MSNTTGYLDCTGRPIHIGNVIEHTRHGARYRVCLPGTDGYLESHDGPILVAEDIRHRNAFKLTDRRANKARVVA